MVDIYPPILPICAERSPEEELAAGLTPSLAELRLHQGSVWPWNRPIYDDVDGGHLRIEMRALPAGPTAVDMVANAAFLIGLAEGVKPKLQDVLPAIPFRLAEYNFYRAARYGLDARLVWPRPEQSGYCEQPVRDIIADSLSMASRGLESIGIAPAEAGRYMDVIRERLATGQRDLAAGSVNLKEPRRIGRDRVGHRVAAVGIQCRCCRKHGTGGRILVHRLGHRTGRNRAVIGTRHRDRHRGGVARIALHRAIIGRQDVLDHQGLAHRQEVERRVARRTRRENPAEIAAGCIRRKHNRRAANAANAAD